MDESEGVAAYIDVPPALSSILVRNSLSTAPRVVHIGLLWQLAGDGVCLMLSAWKRLNGSCETNTASFAPQRFGATSADLAWRSYFARAQSGALPVGGTPTPRQTRAQSGPCAPVARLAVSTH